MSEYDVYDEYVVWLFCALAAYAALTLLPKSCRRVRQFARTNYAKNKLNFHKCYGPELCCHPQYGDCEDASEYETESSRVLARKQRPRRPVARAYPTRQAVPIVGASTLSAKNINLTQTQTQTKVNKIARMFERSNVQVNGRKYDNKSERSASLTQTKFSRFEFAEDKLNLMSKLEALSRANNCAGSEEALRRPMKLPADIAFMGSNGTTSGGSKRSAEHSEATSIAASPSESELSTPDDTTEHHVVVSAQTEPSRSRSATPSPPLVVLRTPHIDRFHTRTSLDDIFDTIAANADFREDIKQDDIKDYALSIDDILSERSLSRPLSAYSITELWQQNEPSSPST